MEHLRTLESSVDEQLIPEGMEERGEARAPKDVGGTIDNIKDGIDRVKGNFGLRTER